ncbi:hypothetical protein E2C01_013603 [Portunus trituberculatus]|uniref:Uncharacterized protein n=1 Tax=Portunus trituberculatus TaxID=210409 RepID=A0A5B7DGQ2_PORTR|nr:hypothetical protein [Portunus trituberculatus]
MPLRHISRSLLYRAVDSFFRLPPPPPPTPPLEEWVKGMVVMGSCSSLSLPPSSPRMPPLVVTLMGEVKSTATKLSCYPNETPQHIWHMLSKPKLTTNF